MKWLERFLGDDWHLHPAGGATGEAYIASQGEKKIFIKRNSSPFLAVLSAEGIVPKLLWTKRIGNGDVITAQQWIEGRELKANEMVESKVAMLLGKIHRSTELLNMFQRIGNKPLTPSIIVSNLQHTLNRMQIVDEEIERGIIFLFHQLQFVSYDEHVVCHGDINHNNWIVDEDETLYLIDWDGASVADPAIDLGLLLYLYVPRSDWKNWLQSYGIELTENLQIRMRFYVISQVIYEVLTQIKRHDVREIERWKQYLLQLMSE